MKRSVLLVAALLLPLILLGISWLLLAIPGQGGLQALRVPEVARSAPATDGAVLARGQRLARIGNCIGCHTRRGGAELAGGRGFETPWGVVYSSNLTPHPEFGIGRWSLAEFGHAMRHGVSRNGALSPVFPFAQFAHLDDTDIAALFAWLSTRPPVAEAPPAHRLEFPASLPGAMLGWRLLYYRPAPLIASADTSAEWRLGQRLVEGIGHCAMCHAGRGRHASLQGGLGGQRQSGWYAPPLDGESLGHFDLRSLADYLRSGQSSVAAANGPMADVVFHGLRYITQDEAKAMAVYLLDLPKRPAPSARRGVQVQESVFREGEAIYAAHCADCHGDEGEGSASVSRPLRLASAVRMADPVNAINMVLLGGGPPSSDVHPLPPMMPPFAQRLSAAEVAAVVSYVRRRFGADQRGVDAALVRSHAGAFLH